MKKSLKATSIVESIVVLLIVVTGIVGVFGLLKSSQELANSTSNRIEAIQIARDGLEAMVNIRETNWLRYGADYNNCWNVLNYNAGCIGDTGITGDMRHFANQGIKIYRDANNRFVTSRNSYPAGNGSYEHSVYRNIFAIRKDGRGFYDQSVGTIYGNGSTPFYTREIQIDYLNAANVSQGSSASNNPKMRITAIVQWKEPNSPDPKRLEMSTILTNWKDKN